LPTEPQDQVLPNSSEEQTEALEGGFTSSNNTASATPRRASSTSFVSAKSQSIKDGEPKPRSSVSASNANHQAIDLEKAEETEQPQPLDPNIVDWDGPDDPKMVLNWSKQKKWGTVGMLSALTFIT